MKKRQQRSKARVSSHKSHPGSTPVQKDEARSQRIKSLFICAASFLSGASIMVIELSGNRVLAPFFGNSLYTWTALIGVILISLSAGYYLGGVLVDRRPRYTVLSHLLLVAAVFTLLVPLLQAALSPDRVDVHLIAGPLFTSLLLFALPACLLAAVTPFSIRMISLASSDTRIGVSSGLIGMLSTLGSVIGTFAAGFVLIPLMDLRLIFVSVGLALAVLSIVGYIIGTGKTPGKHLVRILVIAAGSAILVVLSMTIGQDDPSVIHEETTFYHRIRITETKTEDGYTRRAIHLDTTLEGAQLLETRRLPIPYQRYWELAKLYVRPIRSAAFLGGGGFGMPEALLDDYPSSKVDVVEIDPAVIALGRRYFRLDEYPGLHPHAMDARRFLRHTRQAYDLIFGDVYQGVQNIPPHLVTSECFDLIKDRLQPQGVFMMNIISAVNGPGSRLFKALCRTLSTTFDFVSAYPILPQRPRVSQNIILVASNVEPTRADGLPMDDARRISELARTKRRMTKSDIQDGFLLRDNHNPIDQYLARRLWLAYADPRRP